MYRPVSRALLLASAVIVTTACQSEPIEVNPGLAIARLGEVPEGGALYSISHDLYLVDAGDDGLIALSRRDPFRGCTVQLVDDQFPQDGWHLEPGAQFVDPCHGGQYDLAGRYLAGPSEEDLTRIPIEVIAGVVYLDPNPAADT